ncbi:MAG: hypothetical protein QOF61_2854 [Acidobacteriota bacterium]|jgi:hypothetical protein|nr:hypothetical protein [Acidobacteriota bacterium]
MDELIKQVTERTGISEEQARTAVNTVISHLKNGLPASISGQLDSLIGGGTGAVGDLTSRAEGIIGGLGGMFEKKD